MGLQPHQHFATHMDPSRSPHNATNRILHCIGPAKTIVPKQTQKCGKTGSPRLDKPVLRTGLQRSGADSPLSSSRACLHTALIAVSVLCMFDNAIVRWHGVHLRSLPGLGERLGPAGSGHYRRVTPRVYSELGRGCYACSMLACTARGVLAVAGLPWPRTFHLCSSGHGGSGERRVGGRGADSMHLADLAWLRQLVRTFGRLPCRLATNRPSPELACLNPRPGPATHGRQHNRQRVSVVARHWLRCVSGTASGIVPEAEPRGSQDEGAVTLGGAGRRYLVQVVEARLGTAFGAAVVQDVAIHAAGPVCGMRGGWAGRGASGGRVSCGQRKAGGRAVKAVNQRHGGLHTPHSPHQGRGPAICRGVYRLFDPRPQRCVNWCEFLKKMGQISLEMV